MNFHYQHTTMYIRVATDFHKCIELQPGVSKRVSRTSRYYSSRAIMERIQGFMSKEANGV